MADKNQKSSLRAEIIVKRLEIPPKIAEKAALAVASCFLEIIPKDAVVAGYCAMRGEIDVMPLLKELAEQGNQICLPVIQESPPSLTLPLKGRGDIRNEKILKFLSWSPSEELCAGKFGTLCPKPRLPEMVPDVVIVPLVGFDADLHRLGYGGGYYDATIAYLREENKNVRIIGAAYDIQFVEILPAEEHDEKLDMVVTESGLQIK